MDLFSIIAKNHQQWIDTCKLFGVHDYPEDLVQDMYLKIFNAKNVTKQNYKGYVYVTLRNLCYDRHKNKKHNVEITDDITPDNLNTDGKLIWLDIQKVLHELPYFERQIIELHNIQGISLREIERETGLCPMKMSRAKTKGIEYLEKCIKK